MRIHRWKDAPNELRRAIDPGKASTFDWLAEVPAHRMSEAEGDFGWAGVVRHVVDGGVLIAGREAPWGTNGA